MWRKVDRAVRWYTEQIKALKTRISELSTLCAELQKRIEGLEKRIEGLEKKIEDLTAQHPIPPPRRSKQKNPEEVEEEEVR